MRILLVAQNFLPFIGGVETHARQVAHTLAARGHDVQIVAVNFGPFRRHKRLAVLHTSLLAPTHDDYADGALPVKALTPRGPLDRARLLPIALRAVPKLRRVAFHQVHRMGYPAYRSVFLRRLERLVDGVDVVHSLANDYLGWTAQTAARRHGAAFVNTPFVHPSQWGDGPNDLAYYQACDAVIGLVDSDTAYLESIGVPREKLHTIGVSPDLPPTADPEGFRKRHGLGDAPVVLYVGRMMAQKGARAVVEDAPRVWERFPDTRFLFIGPGNDEEVSIFAGRDPRLSYLGKVSAQEKADALAACDIFCMPSMSEILPTVYLEAWSLGKPVVGGRAHGLPELVEGNGAGFAASQEPGAVADSLARLLGDPDLRAACGAAGRALVERNYTVDAVTTALERLYADCVAARKRTSPVG